MTKKLTGKKITFYKKITMSIIIYDQPNTVDMSLYALNRIAFYMENNLHLNKHMQKKMLQKQLGYRDWLFSPMFGKGVVGN